MEEIIRKRKGRERRQREREKRENECIKRNKRDRERNREEDTERRENIYNREKRGDRNNLYRFNRSRKFLRDVVNYYMIYDYFPYSRILPYLYTLMKCKIYNSLLKFYLRLNTKDFLIQFSFYSPDHISQIYINDHDYLLLIY